MKLFATGLGSSSSLSLMHRWSSIKKELWRMSTRHRDRASTGVDAFSGLDGYGDNLGVK
jgi:hypothetical protein